MSTTLVVLVPLLVAPVVLLLAFAGCTSFGAADPPPAQQPPPDTKPPDPPKKPDPPTGPVYGTTVLATTGLVAYWRLDEPSGTTLVESGPDKLPTPPSTDKKFTGQYRTTGVALGRPGALSPRDTPDLAAEFAGTSGYAEVPFKALLNPGPDLVFTIEAWVKPSGAASVPETQTLVSSRQFVGGGWNGYELVMLRPGGASPSFAGRVYAGGAGPRNEIVADPEGDADAWRHVVMTYDNGTLDLTVTIIGSPPITPASATAPLYRAVTAGTFRLGAGHQNPPGAFNFLAGLLDEVAFYNARLTQAQIAEHVKAATP